MRCAADPDGADRAERIDRLVACAAAAARSAAAPLARHATTPGCAECCWRSTPAGSTGIRELRDLQIREHDGRLLGIADYDHEGRPIHLVTGYARLEAAARAVPWRSPRTWHGRTGAAKSWWIWRPGGAATAPIDDDRRRGRQTPRRLRLRPPAAPAGRDRDHRRRRGAGAVPHPSRDLPPARTVRFVEDLVYRNLHPMLRQAAGPVAVGELPAARGCARPRTCTSSTAWPTTTPRTTGCSRSPRCATSPRCGDATGAAVPAAGADGAAGTVGDAAAPGRVRRGSGPAANRIVLYVRPPWDVPREAWRPGPVVRAAGRRRRPGEGACCASGSPRTAACTGSSTSRGSAAV